jgi:TctA family transporter
MGSITAILFNIPGSVSSTPALLEGYPLSQRGLTRLAIACAGQRDENQMTLGVFGEVCTINHIVPFGEGDLP